MINLAKQALDVGLYTNQLDEMLAFWQGQIGLEYAEMLPVGSGVRQHRHKIGESILKINHKRESLTANPPAGLRHLTIYSNRVNETTELSDPDENSINLVPITEDATSPNLRLTLTTANIDAQHHYYSHVLGLPQQQDCYLVGASEIQLQQGPSVDPAHPRDALGFRYMTLQVFDVVGTHHEILNRGGTEGMAPVKLGDVAYISFVRDADGNWIEISQRKSLTGSLNTPGD